MRSEQVNVAMPSPVHISTTRTRSQYVPNSSAAVASKPPQPVLFPILPTRTACLIVCTFRIARMAPTACTRMCMSRLTLLSVATLLLSAGASKASIVRASMSTNVPNSARPASAQPKAASYLTLFDASTLLNLNLRLNRPSPLRLLRTRLFKPRAIPKYEHLARNAKWTT